jgi:hypothetical protein
MPKNMPQQKPHRSEQAYRTPPEFFAAVARTFGRMQLDLAATDAALCPQWIGPGSAIAEDSLSPGVSWSAILAGRRGWLNPPFETLRPWAAKCGREADDGAKIIMLTPASLGSEWYCDEVQGQALTLVVRPRLVFVGETTGYPKDLAIHLFGFRMVGLGTWSWK